MRNAEKMIPPTAAQQYLEGLLAQPRYRRLYRRYRRRIDRQQRWARFKAWLTNG